MTYDDIFRRTNNAQEKAREWQKVREEARSRNDHRAADVAAEKIRDIEGLSPSELSRMRERARSNNDHTLADILLGKMGDINASGFGGGSF